eukprot:13061651-Alexandrium_andersonii.AAC.1
MHPSGASGTPVEAVPRPARFKLRAREAILCSGCCDLGSRAEAKHTSGGRLRAVRTESVGPPS